MYRCKASGIGRNVRVRDKDTVPAEECLDSHINCKVYAKLRFCVNDPQYMGTICCESCRLVLAKTTTFKTPLSFITNERVTVMVDSGSPDYLYSTKAAPSVVITIYSLYTVFRTILSNIAY